MRIPQCSLGIRSFAVPPDDSRVRSKSKSRMTAVKGYWAPKVKAWLYKAGGTHVLLSRQGNAGLPPTAPCRPPLPEGHPGVCFYCPPLLHRCPDADPSERAWWRHRQSQLVIGLRRLNSPILLKKKVHKYSTKTHRNLIKEMSPRINHSSSLPCPHLDIFLYIYLCR